MLVGDTWAVLRRASTAGGGSDGDRVEAAQRSEDGVEYLSPGPLRRQPQYLFPGPVHYPARTVLNERNDVDLILSDVMLPGGVSGADFKREVEADYPNLGFVCMSGHSFEATQDRGMISPDSIFLAKPFSIAGLSSAVRAALVA